MKRTPPPPEPMCLIAFLKFGIDKARLMMIPERCISHAVAHQWIVFAKDSDVPLELGPAQEWAMKPSLRPPHYGEERQD